MLSLHGQVCAGRSPLPGKKKHRVAVLFTPLRLLRGGGR